MLYVSVEDPEVTLLWEWNDLEGDLLAIDKHKVILQAESGDALVQNTAGDANKFILGAAAGYDELVAREVKIVERAKSESAGELECGAAAETCSGMNVAGYEHIETGGGAQAFRAQALYYTEGIICPSLGPLPTTDGVDLAGYLGGLHEALDCEEVVRAGSRADSDGAIYGRAKDETSIIISMVPDKLDTARCGGVGSGGAAKSFFEELREIERHKNAAKVSDKTGGKKAKRRRGICAQKSPRHLVPRAIRGKKKLRWKL